MRILFVVVAVLALVACAEYQIIAAEKGAQAADDALRAATWGHCEAATAASLERKYQLYSNPSGKLATAWRALCYGTDERVTQGETD